MKSKLSFFILSLLLFSSIFSTFAQEKKESLRFIHLTDIHLIFSPENYTHKFINGRYNYFWKDSQPIKDFFKTVPSKLNPDFIAITGDLVDFYEAETNDGRVLGTQIEQFKTLIDSITNHTLYLTLGNHDITSYPKSGYHQNDAAKARATWIKNAPSFSNGTYYSRLYDVGSTTYRLIFIDNSYFSKRDNKNQADFIIDKPQLDWLKSQLKASSTDKEIIFMHMPLPLLNNDESNKESYEEYVNRSRTKEFMDIITKTENSSVQAIVAGHEHINDLYKFQFSQEQSFTQIFTGAFGNKIENWRLFELTESDFVVYDTGSSSNKTIIPLQ